MDEGIREKVGEIVGETLAERFSDIVFGPIHVIPAFDEFGDGDGEEYLRIVVVFDGDQDALDARWTSSLIRLIRPKLLDEGVRQFPSFSFVGKSEWPQFARSLEREAAGLSLGLRATSQPDRHAVHDRPTCGARSARPTMPYSTAWPVPALISS